MISLWRQQPVTLMPAGSVGNVCWCEYKLISKWLKRICLLAAGTPELATSYVPVLPQQNVSQLYRASYYRSYRQRFQVVIKQVTGAPGHCGLPYFQPAASLRSNRLNYIQLCWVGWRSASNMWGILKSQPVFLLGKLSFDGWQWWTCSSSLWEQHI